MVERMTRAQVEDAVRAADTEHLLRANGACRDVYLTRGGLLIERTRTDWLVHRIPADAIDEARRIVNEARELLKEAGERCEEYEVEDRIDSTLEGAFALGDPVTVEDDR